MANENIVGGRYELVAQQGSGGMSVVYRAVDRVLGRNVALKILRPSLTKDPSFLEKFQNEARSIANLAHPNIVTVHDVGTDGKTHYIVMELIEGRDLKKIIQSMGALTIDYALELSTQICAGLGFAHRTGIVHADVKPQNILVTTQGIVKITDFGIAQALSDTQPHQRMDVVWGSPHYFAPEQARGEQPSPPSDVYAIGIVMFEMLTGRLPYTGATQQALAMAHIKDPIPLASHVNPSVPEDLARIIYRVMSKEPNQRYQTADQLGNVLRKYRDSFGARTVTNAPVPPPLSPSLAPSSPSSPNPTPPPVANYQPGSIPPPVDRPPGIGPNMTSEPTARFSAAPVAQQSYHPRQAAHPQANPPHPDQGYIPAPPRNPSSERAGYSAQYAPPPDREEGEGIDVVTIVLAFLAFVAIAGLIPLYLAVIAARAGG